MTTRSLIIVTVILTAVAALATVAVYPSLPERIPIHWNLHGEVDGWSSRQFGAVFGPAMMLGITALLLVLPRISPAQFRIDEFRPVYNYVTLLLVLLFGYIHAVALWAALHPEAASGRALVAGLMLMFAAMGNVLGKVRRNFWMGIRTPWTLASDRVWIATHRLSARLLVAAGLVGAMLAVFGGPLPVVFVLLMAAVLAPAVYSLVLYRRLEG